MPEIRWPIITLTTDFGIHDHYVAAVKASILSIAAQVRIVDVTHEIPAHHILHAAWVVRNAAPGFPRRSIHLAVVDPGVGTSRRSIVVSAGEQIYVGPDNGIFSYVLDKEPARVVEITATHYLRPEISSVFHARDIFAPAAAHMARGVDPAQLGGEVTDPVKLDLPRPKVAPDGTVRARVAHVDRFGNAVLYVMQPAVTALLERVGAARLLARAGKGTIARTVTTYGEGPPGEPVLLFNSSGFLEIGCNKGRAADLLGLVPGSVVDLVPERA